jgi:hypothetical protein
MKTTVLFILSICLSLSMAAQTVTLHFTGTNKTRNFQAVLNGISYYSNSSAAEGGKKITINTLEPGNHTLAVYRSNNNRYNSGVTGAATAGAAVYTKTFVLRNGYDMNIAIRANGQVSFTEKRNSRPITVAAPAAMSASSFNTLLTSVKSKWSQSSRLSTIRTAISTKTNYFTTDQVGELLTLITSEASRFELVKLAFPKTTDQAAYSSLTELFTTQSYKDNLEAFIQTSLPGNTGPVNGNATTAMSATAFNQLSGNVRNQWSQTSKASVIRTAFTSTSNFFSTNQVGELLSQITAEANRLELAKLVYPRVIDKSEYRELTELFTTASIRTDFETFIGVTPSGNSGVNYGNRTPVSDVTFTSLLQTVNNQYQQSGKIAVVKDALNNTSYYFTTTQLRQLITPVSAETDRLALLKQSYSRVADVSSFYTLNDLLYNQSSRAELDTYVRTGGTTTNSNYSNRIAITDAEFSRLEFKARLHFRQSSTVEDISEAFRSTTNYYSVAQIRQLLSLVTTEADRLTLAKLAFHRVTDPTGYKQLDDLFTTQASRDELARYTAANWF